jgi:hypothetical protein
VINCASTYTAVALRPEHRRNRAHRPASLERGPALPGAWRGKSGTQPEWDGFDQDLKRIDQELAHLTYNRSRTGAAWSFFPALTTALLEFVNTVATSCPR